MQHEGRFIHGMSRTPTYKSWDHMIDRCTNERHDKYAYYGGRGIKVDERWFKFANFLADMGVKPAGTSLDRINNSGPYTKNNCRWASKTQQANNKRSNVRLVFRNESHTISEWARIKHIKAGTLSARVARGWSIEKAITTPV